MGGSFLLPKLFSRVAEAAPAPAKTGLPSETARHKQDYIILLVVLGKFWIVVAHKHREAAGVLAGGGAAAPLPRPQHVRGHRLHAGASEPGEGGPEA